jgi:WD40 repeat protein
MLDRWYNVRKHVFGNVDVHLMYILVTYLRGRFTFYQIERDYERTFAASAAAASASGANDAQARMAGFKSADDSNPQHLRFSFARIACHPPHPLPSRMKPSAICCTWRLDESAPPRLITATDDGSLHVYEMRHDDASQYHINTAQFEVEKTLGPITYRNYGVRSKRKPIATTMCALPGGRLATAGDEDGLIRIWNLNEPISSDGVASTVELRVPEHAGRRIIDLQLAAIN